MTSTPQDNNEATKAGFASQFDDNDEESEVSEEFDTAPVGGDNNEDAEAHEPFMNRFRRGSTLRTDLNALEEARRMSYLSNRSSIMSNMTDESSDPLHAINEKIVKSRRKSSVYHRTLLGLARELSQFDLDSDDDYSDAENNGSVVIENSSSGLLNSSITEHPHEEDEEEDELDPTFESVYAPSQMRCLALVAHNHMKPAMKQFVLANKNLLKHFKLTGTNTTMTMLREVFGDDPAVEYGPTCTSGPLGGDAELVAVMCTENLGGCVFFQDPMSAHPHTADIECLSRQANVHNVLMMPNPATAFAVMTTLRLALKEGRAELIPSFFQTLESPSVAEYKVRQAQVVTANK